MRAVLLFLFLNTILHFSTKAQSKLYDYLPLNENQDSIILHYKQIKETNIGQMAKADIQYFIIKAEKETYGYTIFLDGHLVIEQKTIPGLSGSLGFKNIPDTHKIAELVIKKMKEGEMPPTISEHELIELKISNRH